LIYCQILPVIIRSFQLKNTLRTRKSHCCTSYQIMSNENRVSCSSKGELSDEPMHTDSVVYSVTKEVAASLNNTAARLYREKHYEDAFRLLRNSLDLLNKVAVEEQEHARFSCEELTFYSSSEVCDIFQPMLIPSDVQNNVISPTNHELASVAILYNLFLILRKVGRTEDALQMLQLTQRVLNDTSRDDGIDCWHPSLRLAIFFQLGTMLYEVEKYDDAWQNYSQAIEIGKKYLPREMLFASLYSHVGFALLEASQFEEAGSAYDDALAVYNRASKIDCAHDNSPSRTVAAAAA